MSMITETKTIYDNIREDKMKNLLEQSQAGDQKSYQELIDLLEKMFKSKIDQSFVSYMISKLRQRTWPEEHKKPELLGLINDQTFEQLKMSYPRFEQSCKKNDNTSRV